MSHANVPKFGNWNDEDNVPYTVFFDKARKNKGGKVINPTDPQDNPDMFPNQDPSPPLAPSKSRTKQDEPIPIGSNAIRASPQHRMSEGSDFSKSPQRSTNESNYGGRGQRPARTVRPSAGSEQSFELSPLHHQAKVTGRGGVSPSPAWEVRNHDSSHGTTGGRSRLRGANRGDESLDNGAAVPIFGDWEKDPKSAENFTEIFDKHREEKITGTGNVLGTPKHPSYGTPRRQQQNEQKKCCLWW